MKPMVKGKVEETGQEDLGYKGYKETQRRGI